jgi:hypothetical protein
MKTTILSHSRVPAGHEELHRFSFQLEDGGAPPYVEMVSLRTAKVIVGHLEDGNAFIKMLREIVTTAPHAYNSLVGRTFRDSSSDGVSDRLHQDARSGDGLAAV